MKYNKAYLFGITLVATLGGFLFGYDTGVISGANDLLQNYFNLSPAEIIRALEVIWICHADHEQNASTSTVRIAGSSLANPFACIAAGIAALWGPAHGGANEAVLTMLDEIGVAAFLHRLDIGRDALCNALGLAKPEEAAEPPPKPETAEAETQTDPEPEPDSSWTP